MEVGSNEMVMMPASQLEEMIGKVVDAKFNYWLSKQAEADMQAKRDEEVMLTIKECVAKYKICRTTLYKKCKDGTIPHSRIGARVLISKAAIEAAIKSQSVAI
ncbi:MAG: helix-turn-helix domain-containing protein [Prevotella sp.]|jgi:excisionase family DNA binding protein|nr:helix-turn-helix domain-containing protein [Prevotella sp.]